MLNIENENVRIECAGWSDTTYPDEDYGEVTVRDYEFDAYDVTTGTWLGSWHEYDYA